MKNPQNVRINVLSFYYIGVMYTIMQFHRISWAQVGGTAALSAYTSCQV